MGQVNPALFTEWTKPSRRAVILTRVSSTSAARFVVCVHPFKHTQNHTTPATVCFNRMSPPELQMVSSYIDRRFHKLRFLAGSRRERWGEIAGSGSDAEPVQAAFRQVRYVFERAGVHRFAMSRSIRLIWSWQAIDHPPALPGPVAAILRY